MSLCVKVDGMVLSVHGRTFQWYFTGVQPFGYILRRSRSFDATQPIFLFFKAFMDEAIICFEVFPLLLQLGVYGLRKPARRRVVTLSVQLSDCMEAFD
jgi:hypothetical protein